VAVVSRKLSRHAVCNRIVVKMRMGFKSDVKNDPIVTEVGIAWVKYCDLGT
jgi:hypothetical protein